MELGDDTVGHDLIALWHLCLPEQIIILLGFSFPLPRNVAEVELDSLVNGKRLVQPVQLLQIIKEVVVVSPIDAT